MPLALGSRLGPYEILSPIGAGGMGEVYRAKDTRLDRTVAIKVLPSHLSDDLVRRQRFEREARSISALSHPHICTLHDIGRHDGIDYLVMEFLEGETLSARLRKGPLPLEQLLKHSLEIASALDKAHRQGVVHRDLKPDNIILTKTGAKLLDFGLARSSKALLLKGAANTTTETSDHVITGEGVIAGTLRYMAPEQLEGKEADARSDIFALGAVIYEMATGRKAFDGESQASVIAAIFGGEPPEIASLQPAAPPALDRLVRRCLAKDPDERWQSAADLKWEIENLREVQAPLGGVTRRTPLQLIPTLSALAVGLTLGCVLTWFISRQPAPEVPRVTRTVVNLPPGERLAVGLYPSVALSPDKRHLVYVTLKGSRTQFHLRPLDQFESKAIAGTDGAVGPFFSPDGEQIGFFAEGKFKKVARNGGSAVDLFEAGGFRGASWSANGSIVATPMAANAIGLWQFPAGGGAPRELTVPDPKKQERSDRWPDILPGGKAAVFTDWTGGSFDDARIALVDLDSGERRVLLEGGTAPRYAPSGFLLYARSGILQAVRFDPTQLRVSGQPAPIINGVMTDARTGAGQFSVAGDTVVYVPGTLRIPELSVVLVARSGQTRPLMAARQAYGSPRLSPDGRRLAVAMSEGTNRNVWIYDLALTRFTLGGGTSTSPCWSPDGKRLVFTSTRAGAQNLFWAPADGGGPEVQLTASPYPQVPNSWSPDGRWLLFTERRAGTSAQRIERHHVDLEALGRTQISLEVCLRRRSM